MLVQCNLIVITLINLSKAFKEMIKIFHVTLISRAKPEMLYRYTVYTGTTVGNQLLFIRTHSINHRMII